MKGIILAGGLGTRLYPLTRVVSKQLLPVYDKPMIYYPLTTLMLAGIREILIISTPKDLPHFQQLLGDGALWGLKLQYAEQPQPDGLPQAFLIGEKFLNGDPCCLILGDNLFFGYHFRNRLMEATKLQRGAKIFLYPVSNPQSYGVAIIDPKTHEVRALVEKPEKSPSNLAVTGLYFVDGRASRFASELRPSNRGELEIVDLLNCYLSEGSLSSETLGRGYAWLDTGTHASLLEAGQFVKTVEDRQGLKIACPEELAWRNGWITDQQLLDLAEKAPKNYRDYLRNIVQEKISF